MVLPNPCKHLDKKEVKALTIYLDEADKEYKYTINPIKIYEFAEHLNGYTEVQVDDPNKQLVFEKILQKHPGGLDKARSRTTKKKR
jgi:hypothetical protein